MENLAGNYRYLKFDPFIDWYIIKGLYGLNVYTPLQAGRKDGSQRNRVGHRM